jgi:lysyl-tRNA synthetase class 2
MKFTVDQKILQKYPDVKIGVVVVKNSNNRGDPEEIMTMCEEEEQKIATNFSIEALTEIPAISLWRNIYASFGSKPREYRCSIEALFRSVLNGRKIRHINRLVDLYNYISLKYIIPVGGEDLEKIKGDIFFKFASGNENFVPLGAQTGEHPYPGEVIYCDSTENVLCRRWNWRESDRTKLSEETTNAVLVAEGFNDTVIVAIKELSALVKKYCNAETQEFLLDRNCSEITF